MAYMSTEHAAKIRKNLKEAFPGFKFSITKHHHSSICVSILESPLDFSKDFEKNESGYIQLNQYYLDRYSHSDILKQMYNIINKGNFNDSDIQTDYFHVGFFVHFNIGQWNRPYKQIIKK
ncbi:MAG: Sinorhizobium phage phiM7 [Bacteroidota bacterium]